MIEIISNKNGKAEHVAKIGQIKSTQDLLNIKNNREITPDDWKPMFKKFVKFEYKVKPNINEISWRLVNPIMNDNATMYWSSFSLARFELFEIDSQLSKFQLFVYLLKPINLKLYYKCLILFTYSIH